MSKTVFIPSPNSGITNDPRSNGNVARFVSNFDIFSNGSALTPYRDTVDGDSDSTNSQKHNFCIAYDGTNWNIYGLGRQTSLNKPQVLYKALTTGGANDLDDSGWSTPSNENSNVAFAGNDYNPFVYYKKTALIYGLVGGTKVYGFSPTGSSWDDDILSTDSAGFSITYTNTAQGIVHSKDDILYIPYDNVILKNDNKAWSKPLTLPSYLYITSICERGNYLAIACAPLSGVGSSIVYLWDRDSSLTTLSESIDWGEGVIKVLEEIDGTLFGISISGNSTTRFKNRVEFKYYDGSGAVPFPGISPLIDTTGGNTLLLPRKQKIAQRVFFLMRISINGTVRDGLWSLAKVGGSKWILTHEQAPNNDTAINSAGCVGFIVVGDYVFIAYINAAGDYAVSKTNSSSSYTATSYWETKLNPGFPQQDTSQLIKMYSIGAVYDSLPTAGQVVVKHRINGGTYKTVFTETTDGAIYTEPQIQYSDGTGFAELAKEHEFEVESTGGAVVVGLVVKYDFVESNA